MSIPWKSYRVQLSGEKMDNVHIYHLKSHEAVPDFRHDGLTPEQARELWRSARPEPKAETWRDRPGML
jgi:hypothetical protein